MRKPKSRDDAVFGAERGVVYLVGAGPGDPGLITARGIELLATADVVLHDELVHPAILEHAAANAEIRYVGKRGADPRAKQTAQAAIDSELVALARKGLRVVRLKGGDPFLFGRGSEEAEALVRAGIPFEVVPGVASPLGATAYAGISLTHRDLASSVTFVSGTARSGAPFDWTELAGVRGTICVLMAMRRLEDVTRALIETAKRAPSTPAVVIQWGTRAEQAVVEGRLDAIAEAARAAGLGSPAILVVGQVVSLRKTLRWFDTRPLFGKRVLVMRAREQAGAAARLVRRRGGEAIEIPTIEIVDPPDPERVRRVTSELGAYDVVVLTSANGVEKLFAALDAAGRDARAFGGARVAAIGSGTAAALAARGIRADIVPEDFRGEALAAAILADPSIADRLGRGERARVLVARALVARDVVPDTLRARGVEVDVVPVYETRPASSDRRVELERMLSAGEVDVALLTSSSTARNLCDLLGARAHELLRGVLLASIGPVTTKSAEERGLTVAVTATESTLAGLMRAVEGSLASPPGKEAALATRTSP